LTRHLSAESSVCGAAAVPRDRIIQDKEKPAAAAGDQAVIETTTKTFAKDVLEPSRRQPVLVDFWAPWCGPCRTLGPIIEKTVRATRGAVRLVKMNIDDHPAIAGQLGIQSIPAVIAYVDGQPVDGFVGALPESQVKAFIDRLVGPVGPSAGERLIEDAEARLAAGDLAGAAERFAAAVKAEPESVPAILGLARCLIARKDLDRARQTLALLPATAESDATVAAVRAQLELASQAAALGERGPLEARIAANPADHQARFDLALLLNAHGERLPAAEQLLEIHRRDRNWSEEKARKQLLQFFEAWGPMDEATLTGRRRLSSMLFA
jgi:putative thioredoxin